VGPLLSAPPASGELKAALDALSQKTFRHPMLEGRKIRLARSTLERWFYTAKKAKNPIEALRRNVRKDAGRFKAMDPRVAEALYAQYREFPHFTYRLHHDNLAALLLSHPDLGALPSYPSLVRFMKAKGLLRTKRTGNERRSGLAKARDRLDRLEVRSFEVDHVGGLWHLDFHTSRHVSVLGPGGRYIKPVLLAILDDRSRLCCHGQFYLDPSCEILVHGFCQALLKRGLPRALMSDNGGEMTAAEFVEGCERLSILHETTLPYSPYQNGKQEHFFAVVESRFLSMVDRVPDLQLDTLNTMLNAWIEGDYHRTVHTETRQTPLERFLEGPDVLRAAPHPDRLKEAFRRHLFRRIRRSDATLSLEGIRFEVPYAYRHLERVRVASARWDLGFTHLVDPRCGKNLVRIFPVDKSRNASGERRSVDSGALSNEAPSPSGTIPPYLKQLLEEYAASGLPPAYLSHNEEKNIKPDDMDKEQKS
jgi:transposase InsO family protein